MSNRNANGDSILKRIVKWPQAGIVAALLILYVLLAVDDNAFYSSSNMINILRQTSIKIMIGIPITFTLAAGLLDLSIGSLACLGAIVTCACV